MQNHHQNLNDNPNNPLQLKSEQVAETPNTFSKYCPNVWLAKCSKQYQKGDFIDVENRFGKVVECEVHNFIYEKAGFFYYSITRCDGLNRQTYAERKAEKYRTWEHSAQAASFAWFKKSEEGREFLSLGEPIKVGHHSEKRHRALIERNHNRMNNSVEAQERAKEHSYKAEYWESRTKDVDLSMPESVDYFTYKLEQAEARQKGLKDGSIPRDHGYSLAYATKDVKELKSKLEKARKLWL